MSPELPRVTVIIPARPGAAEVLALDACRRLDYPRDRLEVLLVRGRHPSVQRNAALREAQGELVYFLDDDAVPPPDILQRMVPQFESPDVVMVGGPSVCPPDAPPWEQAFARVTESWLAFGPSRARYAAVGSRRATTEKELILCSLAARRAALLNAGCFDEALYPNEENALMDALIVAGGRLIYDPGLEVVRRPRRTLRAFARMLWTYGRGRAEQFRRHPTPGSALNFVPPLFCAYLGGLGLLPGWAAWPLAGYVLAVAAQTVALAQTGRPTPASVPGLILLSHLAYGLGFWRGLFTRLRPDESRLRAAVELERPSLS